MLRGSGDMRPTGIFWDSVGYLWLLGPWVLASFGGGGLLDIAILTLVLLFILLSLACPCLCNDNIQYEHAPNRHTRGGEGACKVTT